jgi:MFS family permease
MTVASAAVPQSSTDNRRWATLAIVCLAQLMIVLDVTIVNVALPAIQHDLHFSQGNLTWVAFCSWRGASAT